MKIINKKTCYSLTNLVSFGRYAAQTCEEAYFYCENGITIIVHPKEARLRYAVVEGKATKFINRIIEKSKRPIMIWVTARDKIRTFHFINESCIHEGRAMLFKVKKGIAIKNPTSDEIFIGIEKQSNIRNKVIRSMYKKGVFSKIVCKYQDRIIGSVFIYVNEDSVGIYELRVNYRFRKRGIGTQLINRIREIAITLNVGNIVAQTSSASNFFMKNGFIPEGKLFVGIYK